MTSGLVRSYDLTMPELARAINQDTTSTTVLPLDTRGRIRGRAFRVLQRRAYSLRDEASLRLKILSCMLPEI